MSRTKKSTQKLKKQSQSREVWRRLRKNKLAMVGLIVAVLLILSAIFAPWLTPYDYDKQN